MATQNAINNKAYVFNSDTSITAATNIITTAGSVTVGATSGDAVAMNLDFKKSRAGGIITTGDVLGEINFQGQDGTGYEVASRITSTSSGTIGADRIGSDLKFKTQRDTTDAAILRMTINNAGGFTIAAPDAGTALTVSGGRITATAGDITATAGDGVLTNGDITIGNTDVGTTTPIAYFKKSRTGGVLTSGDLVGTIKFAGHDGTQYTDGARIESTSSGTIANTRLPANLVFYTHPNSAAANPTIRMTIAPEGDITIAKPTGSEVALTITDGGFTVTAGNTTITPIAGGADFGVVLHGATGVLASSGVGAVGEVLTSGGAGVTPAWAAAAGGFIWAVTTIDLAPMLINHGYITNKAVTACNLALPTTAAVGILLEVAGMGATGWVISQAANQMIHFGTLTTTTGVGGSLASTADRDCVRLVCTVANLEFEVISSVGNVTVV